MKRSKLSHLADHVVMRGLVALASQDCVTTADLLAHIAEVDERRLYLPAGHSSMYAFCVHALHMSEDVAYKRIGVAREARRFPRIFDAVAEGALNLSTVLQLAPRLTPENADELLTAAARKTRAEVELLLAERFPQPDVPTLLSPVESQSTQLAPGRVGPAAAPPAGELVPEPAAAPTSEPARVVPDQLAPGRVESPIPPLATRPAAPVRARVAPLSPGRFALQVTVDQETREQLRYAQALLGHAVPSGNVAEVLKRALNSLVRELEAKRFAKSARPSQRRRGSANPRHVPAAVRRTVWQRDGGKCTFVSQAGKRCDESARLELDHIEPLARGGRTVVSNLRLRCRAHNQHEADCAFGAGFMRGKRLEARRAAAAATVSPA